jgi:hypothetical protein
VQAARVPVLFFGVIAQISGLYFLTVPIEQVVVNSVTPVSRLNRAFWQIRQPLHFDFENLSRTPQLFFPYIFDQIVPHEYHFLIRAIAYEL